MYEGCDDIYTVLGKGGWVLCVAPGTDAFVFDEVGRRRGNVNVLIRNVNNCRATRLHAIAACLTCMPEGVLTEVYQKDALSITR